MILHCNCQETRTGDPAGATHQDAIHGHGQRVHNELTEKQTGRLKWRCTICGHERYAKETPE